MEPGNASNRSADLCGFCGRGEESIDICGALHKAEITEDGNHQTITAHHKCLVISILIFLWYHFFGRYHSKAIL